MTKIVTGLGSTVTVEIAAINSGDGSGCVLQRQEIGY